MKMEKGEKEIFKVERISARTNVIAYIKVAEEQNANLLLTNQRILFLARELITGKEGALRKEIWIKDIVDVQKTNAYGITPSIKISYREDGKVKNTEITLNPEVFNIKHLIRLNIGCRKDERDKLFEALKKVIE